MDAGLTVSVVEEDPDYLELEIRGWSARCAGTTFVYAEHDQLSKLAECIKGFSGKRP